MRTHEYKHQEARKDAGKHPELSVGRLIRGPERKHNVPEQESRQKPFIVCDHRSSQIDRIGTGTVAISEDHCTVRFCGMQRVEQISDSKSQMGKPTPV